MRRGFKDSFSAMMQSPVFSNCIELGPNGLSLLRSWLQRRQWRRVDKKYNPSKKIQTPSRRWRRVADAFKTLKASETWKTLRRWWGKSSMMDGTFQTPSKFLKASESIIHPFWDSIWGRFWSRFNNLNYRSMLQRRKWSHVEIHPKKSQRLQ